MEATKHTKKGDNWWSLWLGLFYQFGCSNNTRRYQSTEAELSNMLNLNSTEPTTQSIEIPKQNICMQQTKQPNIHMLDTYQQVNHASPWTCQSSCTCSPQSWRPVPSKIHISISANLTWYSYNCEQVDWDSQPQDLQHLPASFRYFQLGILCN